MAPSENFLDALVPIEAFEQVFSGQTGTLIPEDWLLIATDILGSTKAIESGRYKEVNTLGAASIIQMINACKPHRIAYQFGGDGSLLAVPPSCREPALTALANLADIAQNQFQLKLRLGIWKASEFLSRDHPIRISKYTLVDEEVMFFFQGTGVAVSDQWLKGTSPVKSIDIPKITALDNALSKGLSCRWNPLKSQNGVMLTGLLLPRNRANAPEVLAKAHEDLEANHSYNTRPVSIASLNPGYPPKDYYAEWRVRTAGKPMIVRLAIYLLIQLQVLAIMPLVGLLKAKLSYIQGIATRSDFQKYDGTYRFVRDLTPEHAANFRTWCEAQHEAGELYFGLWESDTALMTCLLLDDFQHVHFIDGGDGGYAMAALELKKQLAQSSVVTSAQLPTH
jgi:hypothetical protein